MSELNKRILTGLFLIIFLLLSIFYSYILLILLIIMTIVSWIEFNGLFSKIFSKNNFKVNFLKLFLKTMSLFYLIIFSSLIFNGIVMTDFTLNIIYLFFTCIFSDLGGFIVGKTFKGKKLIKISPNKTISGAIGSFILPLFLVPIFYYLFPGKFNYIFATLILTIYVSFLCQLGDLFISYLKRKAKVKDTGDILPGHGGVLDRIDGMLLAVPIGIYSWKFLMNFSF